MTAMPPCAATQKKRSDSWKTCRRLPTYGVNGPKRSSEIEEREMSNNTRAMTSAGRRHETAGNPPP
jgi:hypothetical protein